MKKFLFVISLLICSLLQVKAQQSIDSQLQKLLIAESAIENLYVDKVEDGVLVEAAIRGMLEELDPHSTYLTADEVEKSNESLQGNFDGIGIQFNMIEDTLFVVQPLPNGPSEKVGILAGDRIITVNDTSIAGVKMSQENIMKRLRGPKGTEVKIGIKRQGLDELVHFNVIRDKIPVNTVDAAYMAADGVGYIKVSSFGLTTLQEFQEKMKELQSAGAKSLILDLQGNGGGYLHAAVELANEFLERDQLIVYTEGRRSPRSGYKAVGNGMFKRGKLVILIDEYSASASEIVSGAVQDWDRGTIVGRRSFGKGLVQRPIEFHDGSMIRLTIAQYFTPVGRCIQKPYGDNIDYGADIIKRLEGGELTNADSIHLPDSLKYRTKIKGRTVYGGGGIMPDVFVPLDTTRTNRYYREVTAKGCVLQTSLAYVEKHRKQLERKYKTYESFNEKFIIDDDILKLLQDKAQTANIDFDEKQWNEVLPIFKIQLKSLIARNIWSMNEYYRGISELDDILQRALQLIKENEL
ncbi:MAG: S41 family peptidase [Bacteroidaceae bacterium]|nr:S41 family peptidase [Bacteroidaceae bacterium]